jgi:uncharacterized protein (TIGR01777 family)
MHRSATNHEVLPRVVIAGGSGFIGQILARELISRGYEVVILTRQATPSRRLVGRPVRWDGRSVEASWVRELEGARALVNLAGESVNRRPTRRGRRRILESRVEPTLALGEGLRQVYRVPEVWVQAGSLAIYGDPGDRVCDESAAVPDRYPADVCVAWEEALGYALRSEMRWAILRIGFVLGSEGGALPVLARLARCGMAARFGNGRQWISWIHRHDMARLFVEAIENPAVHGICNATGLQPLPNDEFLAELRAAVGADWGLPFPAAAMRAVSALVGADPALLLEGRRALPVKLHGLGFRFRFHELEDALADLLLETRESRAAASDASAGEPSLPHAGSGDFAGKPVGV